MLSGVTDITRLDDGHGFDVGTTWRETRVLFGRPTSEELKVTALDPGASYTVEADSRGVRYVSQLRILEAGADRSRVEMTMTAHPAGFVGRVLAATVGRLAQGPTRRALQRDLDDVAAAAERQS